MQRHCGIIFGMNNNPAAILGAVALLAAGAPSLSASVTNAISMPPIETERAVLLHTVPGVRNGNHVQGFCADDDAIYVSQMMQLTKFDWNGRLIKKVAAPSHTGDICVCGDRLYAAILHWGPGAPKDGPKGGIHEYDKDLNLLRKVDFEESMDGIAIMDGVIYAGYGPHPAEGHLTNRFMRVDAKTLKTIDIKEFSYGKKTSFGCQNATAADGMLYAVFYNGERPVVIFDRDVNIIGTPEPGDIRRAVGQGFAHVPRSRANGADNVFMRLLTMNRFVKDREREPIYALIDFFAFDRAANRMVSLTPPHKTVK